MERESPGGAATDDQAIASAPGASRWGAGLSIFVVLALVVAAQALLVKLNADLPIVRNSFIYAHVGQRIADLGYNPLPLATSNELTYGKPFGFSLLCAPFVARYGPNLGTQLASLLSTVAFAVAALGFFVIANRRLGLAPGAASLELALLFAGPLMLYQAWSSYPDTLFAALVVLAMICVERIVDENCRARGSIVLLGVVIWAAVLTKLYGLILGIACPLAILSGWSASISVTRLPAADDPDGTSGLPAPTIVDWRAAWVGHRGKVPWLAAVFGALGIAVIGARAGWNPTINLGAGGGDDHSIGMSELSDGLGAMSLSSVGLVVSAWIVALALAFGVTLLALSFRSRGPRWPIRWILFATIYLLGLVPFGADVAYNMRYIIPVLPLVALAVSRGVLSIPRRSVRNALLAVHAVIATLLILHYNVRSAHEWLRPLDQAVLQPLVHHGWRLDNLRMADHLTLARQIATLNREVEPAGLVHWASRYERDSTHLVIERMGLREDIEVSYSPGRVLARLGASDGAYLAHDVLFPGTTARWNKHYKREALATWLGAGVVRLDPYVAIRTVSTEPLTPGSTVIFEATLPDRMQGSQPTVEITLDGQPLAVAQSAPYLAVWSDSKRGRHEAFARVRGPNFSFRSRPLAVFVGSRAVERLVVDCDDDVEDSDRDGLSLTSSDLELVVDRTRGKQVIGIRFSELAIPPGARIEQAYVQFTAYGTSHGPTTLTVSAEKSPNSLPFSSASGPLRRQSTQRSVVWEPQPWLRDGEREAKQRTHDLAPLVQEVVARPGWSAGNALTILIRGEGAHVARACDSTNEFVLPPALFVEYEEGAR